MKKLLSMVAIFLFLNFTGCYTVIWSPGMDFPTADKNPDYNTVDSTGYYSQSDNYSSGSYGEVYYDEPNYGPYAGYYNIPWWYSIAPVTVSKVAGNNGKAATTRNGDVAPIRNSGDGRGNSGRNTGSTGEIITTPPVSVSGSGSNSSGTTGTDPKKTDSGSDNSRQSSSSGSVRNNDGSRNDGGRK